ncbi:hypothetical protein [Butyricimonas sp. Marseille-P3923]|nr:hypothetical protein [Butyricimonas sp. Marseille-P3923]
MALFTRPPLTAGVSVYAVLYSPGSGASMSLPSFHGATSMVTLTLFPSLRTRRR